MMKIRLRYTSISATKIAEPSGRVEIHNNSTITNVESVGATISVGFSFTSTYEPKIGEIKIVGNIKISTQKEKAEEVLREWENSGKKNLPLDFAEDIHNNIIFNCINEAVLLAREIQLPPPIPMPRISIKEKPKEKEDTSYIR